MTRREHYDMAVRLSDEEREALGTWLRHRGVYSFGLLCDIADWTERHLAARLAAERERIAQAIESACHHTFYESGVCESCHNSARIARQEQGS